MECTTALYLKTQNHGKGYVLPIKHQDQHVRRQNTEKQTTTSAGF